MHLFILTLFVLLLICIARWLLLQRRMGSANRRTHPQYREHQVLIGVIASLVIILALLIVFTSDPGNPDDYLWLP